MANKMRIILASASPRRRELLTQIGLEFEIRVSDVEEKITATKPQQIVQELAEQKARAVLQGITEEGGSLPGNLAAGDASLEENGERLLVIGADTVVACDGRILGKPADAEDARRMLRMLSGRSHEVYTGVCLLYRNGMDKAVHADTGQTRHPETGHGSVPEWQSGIGGAERNSGITVRTFYECTVVHFTPMTDEEIDTYVETKDPLDKAGAYGIQGFCARYISGIEGDYNNVVGLPVGRLYQEAKELLR